MSRYKGYDNFWSLSPCVCSCIAFKVVGFILSKLWILEGHMGNFRVVTVCRALTTRTRIKS